MKKTVNYNGAEITVRGGMWLDIMNSCFYTTIDKIHGYNICQECGNGEIFALPTL